MSFCFFAKLTSIYSTKILAFKKLSFFWAFFCARMSWCSRNPPIFFHLSWQKRQLPLCNKSTHIIFFAKWDQQPVLGQYNFIVLTHYLVAYCPWHTCLLFYNKHEFSLQGQPGLFMNFSDHLHWQKMTISLRTWTLECQ